MWLLATCRKEKRSGAEDERERGAKREYKTTIFLHSF
jgi:hypothetical protein